MRVFVLFAVVLTLGLVFAPVALAQPNGATPPPPPPPPGEVVPNGTPPPPFAAEPIPAPCAPPAPMTYERRGLAATSWAAPCAPDPCPAPCPAPCPPASSCKLRRDCEGFSLDKNGCRYGCFTLWAEGLYGLFQAPEGGLGLPPYVAGGPATPDPLVWSGLDYEGAFGGRLTLQFQSGPQSYWEIRGTYYGSWDSTAQDSGQFGFLGGPGGLGGVSQYGTANLTSEADIFGAEINYWTEVACVNCSSWSIGGGVRFVEIDENTSATGTAPFAPFTSPASVLSEVKNTFIGAQLGGMVRWEFNPCFDFTASVKGMFGYLNRDITVSDQSVFSGGPHVATSTDDELVGGLDLDLIFRFRFNRCFGITAGYNMLFLDNIVRGHDAMDFTMSNSGAVQAVQKTDQAIVHSLLVGLYFNF